MSVCTFDQLIGKGGLADRYAREKWPFYRKYYNGSLADLKQEAKLVLLEWVRESELPEDGPFREAAAVRALRRGLTKAVRDCRIQAEVPDEQDGELLYPSDEVPFESNPRLAEAIHALQDFGKNNKEGAGYTRLTDRQLSVLTYRVIHDMCDAEICYRLRIEQADLNRTRNSLRRAFARLGEPGQLIQEFL